MEYLSTEKILIVDLNSGDISEEELDEELVQKYIGGAGIAKYLYETYAQEEPVVLSTGLLTGTLCPGSSAGTITAKNPSSGKISHAPVNLKVAIELKYAGFDYVVIKGVSEKPVFLWLHDGVADLNGASNVWGSDTWQTTDTWRQELGEDVIQTILIGQAGESGLSSGQVILNYWPSGDRFGFGQIFGQKNIKGVALRGMGLLEVADPEGFVDKCLSLLTEIKKGPIPGKAGVGDICSAIGETELKDWLAPLVHRHSACYNTPYPTNTFVYLDEDPATIKDPEIEEPGFLITDVTALIELKKLGLSAEDACRLMKTCAKQGIDVANVAEQSQKQGLTNRSDIEKALETISKEPPSSGHGVFSAWSPCQQIFGDFGLGEDRESITTWWERRQAVASLFGIHPLFALMAPELSESSLLDLVQTGTELEINEETLDQAVSFLLS